MPAVSIIFGLLFGALSVFLRLLSTASKGSDFKALHLFTKASDTLAVSLAGVSALLVAATAIVSATFGSIAVLLFTGPRLDLPTSLEISSVSETSAEVPGDISGAITKHPGLASGSGDIGLKAAQATMYAMDPKVRESSGHPGAWKYINNPGGGNPSWGFSCVTWVQSAYHSVGYRLDGTRIASSPFVFGKDSAQKINSDDGTWGSIYYEGKARADGSLMNFTVTSDPSNYDKLRPGDLILTYRHVSMYIGKVGDVYWTTQAMSPGLSLYCSPNLNDKNCSDVGFFPLSDQLKYSGEVAKVMRVSQSKNL